MASERNSSSQTKGSAEAMQESSCLTVNRFCDP